MAQLKDTIVQGNLRVTDSLFTDILQSNTANIISLTATNIYTNNMNITSTAPASITGANAISGALTVAGGLAVGETIKVGKIIVGSTYGNNTQCTQVASTESLYLRTNYESNNTYFTTMILEGQYVRPPSGSGITRYLGTTDCRWTNIYTKSINMEGTGKIYSQEPLDLYVHDDYYMTVLNIGTTTGASTTYATIDKQSWAKIFCRIPSLNISNNTEYRTRFSFREYSGYYDTTANSITSTGKFEDYILPEVDSDIPNSSPSYYIITTKPHPRNTTISTSTGSITLSAASTFYLKSGASIIVSQNDAERLRINTQGNICIGSSNAASTTMSTHKLYVEGNAALNGKITFGAASASVITEKAAIQYDNSLEAIKITF